MAIDMKSAPISVRVLEPPIEPQDREQTLLFTELLAVGTTVPVVACEVAAVRHVLHAEEDIQRLTAHGERAIDADVDPAVIGCALGVDACEVVHAAPLLRRYCPVVGRERAARQKRQPR